MNDPAEEIKEIVSSIVNGCAQGGLVVHETLAAFIAQTVVETNATAFALDTRRTPALIEEVVLQSIERLLERDNPTLETLKMQVYYDLAYLSDDTESHKKSRTRNKLIAANKMSITEVIMDDANNFEVLTLLYRRIFRYLLDFAPNSSSNDKAVEREVAASLESVFPRIGLKAFVQLSKEEKSGQLTELAKIVLGIRIFNKDQGRGGAGLDSMDKDTLKLGLTMAQDMEQEVAFFTDACDKYQIAIQRARLIQKRSKLIDGTDDAKGIDKLLPVVSDAIIDRWTHELANRRQYLSFLTALLNEINVIKEKLVHLNESLFGELKNLKTLISNKLSVSKDLVYPHFDAIGACWLAIYEEATILIARSNTFETLCKYRLSFNPTLAEEYYSDSYTSIDSEMDGWVSAEVVVDGVTLNDNNDYDTNTNEILRPVTPFDDSRPNTRGMMTSELDIAVATSKAKLLSVQNTPDFLLLPLELQGFCPWTIINTRGLLVPGKPSYGVIEYENMYFVCDHYAGMLQFLKEPEESIEKLKQQVLRNPELIHLLQLQRWFPNASIKRLLGNAGITNSFSNTEENLGGKAQKRDASTSTPTHFIENYIDINYHWNEWELRRRALKVVNLMNCKTTGQQTDKSHFKRDSESQVYTPKDNGTQTRRDKGVNPPITNTYIAGLRGGYTFENRSHAEPKVPSRYGKSTDDKGSKADSKRDSKESKSNTREARVITLSLDLQ